MRTAPTRYNEHGGPHAELRVQRRAAAVDPDRPRLRAPGDHPGRGKARRGRDVPQGDLPEGLGDRAHELRDPRGLRRPGAHVPVALPGARGDLLRLHRRQHHAGRQLAGRHADHHRRHRRAEEEVLRAAAGGADLRGLLLLRARRRVGRRGHEDQLPQGRRRLRAHRAEALDHQRRRRRLLHRVRARRGDAAAQGHHLLRRRPQDARGQRRQEREQDGPALLQHHRRDLRGRQGRRRRTSSAPRARASRSR